MCRILFWNVKRKDLTDLVCDLALETNADIVVLNESSAPEQATLGELKKRVAKTFQFPSSNSADRFHCFTRFKSYGLTEIHKGFRTSIRTLHIQNTTYLLGFVHGVDIRNYDAETRQSFAEELGDEIRFVKSEQKNNRLILVGDFNMNPFDRGMNLARGLNAMSSRDCVAAGQRKYLTKKYDFYYNPMWSHLGDNSSGPPGTAYDTSNQGIYGWSMLDQVIVNQSIVEIFDSVEILTGSKTHRLADARGRPDGEAYSDHFPILVKLKTNGGNQ